MCCIVLSLAACGAALFRQSSMHTFTHRGCQFICIFIMTVIIYCTSQRATGLENKGTVCIALNISSYINWPLTMCLTVNRANQSTYLLPPQTVGNWPNHFSFAICTLYRQYIVLNLSPLFESIVVINCLNLYQ